MITFAEIETELEKASFTHEQARAVVKVLETSQRKTAADVETDLRTYFDVKFAGVDDKFAAIDGKFAALDDKFVTKEEFHKTIGDFRGEMMKWMFIFWSSQLVAIAGMLFGFLKLLRP